MLSKEANFDKRTKHNSIGGIWGISMPTHGSRLVIAGVDKAIGSKCKAACLVIKKRYSLPEHRIIVRVASGIKCILWEHWLHVHSQLKCLNARDSSIRGHLRCNISGPHLT